ncbi:hypothetical protein BASA83_012225 [Batrachochytrium salamandrivorans]|nr:hypothetical protein BASA83_012225 [Batrachochytrium salamandrivorans]
MGKAYYGLELVGGNKSHLAPLQTTINKGIRLFTGARLSTAIGPLLVETGIGSLLTRSLVSRGIGKIPSARFWSRRRTKQLYRNRYWLTPQSPKTVKQRHSFCIDGDSTNMWRLCIAPKCEQVLAIAFSLDYYQQFKITTQIAGRALDPGVENVYTWLRGGVLNGEADLDQRWLDGNVEHESMGRGMIIGRCWQHGLTDFLQYRTSYQSTHCGKYTTGSPCGSWLTD